MVSVDCRSYKMELYAHSYRQFLQMSMLYVVNFPKYRYLCLQLTPLFWRLSEYDWTFYIIGVLYMGSISMFLCRMVKTKYYIRRVS